MKRTFGAVVDQVLDVVDQGRHQLPVHHVHLAIVHSQNANAPFLKVNENVKKIVIEPQKRTLSRH